MADAVFELRQREAEVMLACAHSIQASRLALPEHSEVRARLGGWASDLAKYSRRRAYRPLGPAAVDAGEEG